MQKQAQAQADYDISKAYEIFRQSQRAVMNTASMGEGTKERTKSSLADEYASTETQLRSNMASTIASAYQTNLQTYQKGITQASEDADERATLKAQVEDFFRQKAESEVTDAEGNVTRPAYFTYDSEKGEDYFSKYLTEDKMEERVAGLTAARFSDLNVLNELAEEDPELYYNYMSNRSWLDPELFDMDALSDMGTYDYENRAAKRSELKAIKEKAENLGIDISGISGTASKQVEDIQAAIDVKPTVDAYKNTYLKGSISDEQYRDLVGRQFKSKQYVYLADGTRLGMTSNQNQIAVSRMRSDISKGSIDYRDFKRYGTEFSDTLQAAAANGTLKVNDIVTAPDTGSNRKEYWIVSAIKDGMPYLIRLYAY